MSSFPRHVDNINSLKAMGFDVSMAIEDGEVTLESWGYDEQADLVSMVISTLQKQQFKVEVPMSLEESISNDYAPKTDIVAAIEAERERCAALCDKARAAIWDYHDKQVRETADTVCINLAVQIRGHNTVEGTVMQQQDKNGTEIKAGDTLFNQHDRDQYHTVLQDRDGRLFLGDFDSPLERYAPQKWWEVVPSAQGNKPPTTGD